MYRDSALWAQAKQAVLAEAHWRTLLGTEGPEATPTAVVLNDFRTGKVRERFDISELGLDKALKQADRKQRELEYEAVRDRYEEMVREAETESPAPGA